MTPPERTVLLRVPADEQGEPIPNAEMVRAFYCVPGTSTAPIRVALSAALRACPRVSATALERYRWNDGITQAERELRGATVARVSALEDAVKKGLWTGHDEGCQRFKDGEGGWDGCTCGHDAARQALEELTELAYDATQEARAEKSAPREAAPEAEAADASSAQLRERARMLHWMNFDDLAPLVRAALDSGAVALEGLAVMMEQEDARWAQSTDDDRRLERLWWRVGLNGDLGTRLPNADDAAVTPLAALAAAIAFAAARSPAAPPEGR